MEEPSGETVVANQPTIAIFRKTLSLAFGRANEGQKFPRKRA